MKVLVSCSFEISCSFDICAAVRNVEIGFHLFLFVCCRNVDVILLLKNEAVRIHLSHSTINEEEAKKTNNFSFPSLKSSKTFQYPNPPPFPLGSISPIHLIH
jgi:hypothetical protein